MLLSRVPSSENTSCKLGAGMQPCWSPTGGQQAMGIKPRSLWLGRHLNRTILLLQHTLATSLPTRLILSLVHDMREPA